MAAVDLIYGGNNLGHSLLHQDRPGHGGRAGQNSQVLCPPARPSVLKVPQHPQTNGGQPTSKPQVYSVN